MSRLYEGKRNSAGEPSHAAAPVDNAKNVKGKSREGTTSGTSDENGAAVMFIDLDGFKTVNDTWGHEFGDHLLAAVAARLLSCVRPEDVLARWGGDEFTLLLQDVQQEGHVTRVIERLEQCLSVPMSVAGQEVAARASMGAVIGDGNIMMTPGGFLRAAGQAMYRAKRSKAASTDAGEMSSIVIEKMRGISAGFH